MPGGLARTAIAKIWHEWSVKAAVAPLWNDLVATGYIANNSNAVDTVVAFIDFQCPACNVAHGIIGHHDVRATVIYRHLPLTGIHPNAEGAARASLCADEQGYANELINILYGSTVWHDDPDWIALAEAVGMPNTGAFTSCLTSERVRVRLRKDRQLAQQLNLKGTPAFVFRSGVEIGFTPSGRWSKLLPPRP